ncbi:MAG: beta-propeller fold lactonase family protein [Gemmatimonadales bacterium]|nr:beta-propeller fold lactonase family protein [Gemmatimonadales bacterium]NIN12170.1 beta-propeller fold lactonase family protein [Gemmatimonadales bacterium]NIN50591.1 beta-propeller fold lactonase family protein [Gemmatimonadales bacterium]NIP08055.1 beta-propeller fold lactonase family protein [Gemmatimonadales bacterium]NIR00637.1 beta-propeller fold lactonase family protein [Gemmatimonadales bacterium]
MKRHVAVLLLPIITTGIAGWASIGQGPGDRVYVGERVCRQCHHLAGDRDQFNPWRLSKHAKAYAALSMPEARQIADLSGIDADPHESPICLGCHTTAYNAEEWERDETFHLEDGVQCELCHGPGSEYADAAIMQEREKAVQAGLKIPEERDCLVCHKEKGSHTAVLEVRPFDYEEAFRTIAHRGSGGPTEPGEDTPPTAPLPGRRYVGALACAECHNGAATNRAYDKWRVTGHAQAYAVLGTDRAAVIAQDMGVSGNPQESAQCLECHTTGAGEPAGRFTESFDPVQGVQCESCHGPGSEYMAEAIMLDPVAAAQAGLWDVDGETCITCHTAGIHGQAFDADAMWSKINHAKWEEDHSAVEYKTPLNLAITRDGTRLFVTCEASNSLIVVDAQTDAILVEVEIGTQPHFVTFSPDQTRAYVSNRGSDNVSVVDTDTYQVLSTIDVGDEPHEMATNADGTILYVANAGTYDVSVVDLAAGKEVKRLAASRGPWGVARSPDGRFVYVTNNLPRYGAFRAPPTSEVTVIETTHSTVTRRSTVSGANLIQGVAFAPGGEFALVTLIRSKNLVPMTRNEQGWIITNGIGVLWQDGRVDQLLLDEVSDFFADPTDVVFSHDGRYAFVSGGGVQEIAVIDVQKMIQVLERATPHERSEVLPDHLSTSVEFTLNRIPVGRSPRGMAVSPDGKYLFVADGLDDAISVIDIAARERVRVIDLGGPSTITEARSGERIFHSAQHTYARQFSCHSCHPDGHIDGITYDIEPDGLGINPVDNRTLRGINDTAPFKWKGTNPTLRRQCGPRLAAFFTRVDPFTAQQSAALDRYIVTITRPPNRYRNGDTLTPAQRRGKQLFERQYDNSGNQLAPTQRCVSCHPPPYFTNRNVYDVGTASWLDTNQKFDVPHLNNIYDSSPYLHDGRAQSLEEIWTVYNPHDKHGLTNDLTKDELNDLIEFLKTL